MEGPRGHEIEFVVWRASKRCNNVTNVKMKHQKPIAVLKNREESKLQHRTRSWSHVGASADWTNEPFISK
jgi:hypothetical protein